nr:DUF6323 family protein [bacterium]
MANLPELIQAQQASMAHQLQCCNKQTARYGLELSREQINTLIKRHQLALQANGRVEFGEGILKKLIDAFCDSPYLFQEHYAETLLSLQDCFYYAKNETQDLLTDDELIDSMRQIFDGAAQGSLEYLCGTFVEQLCMAVRAGKDWVAPAPGEDEGGWNDETTDE